MQTDRGPHIIFLITIFLSNLNCSYALCIISPYSNRTHPSRLHASNHFLSVRIKKFIEKKRGRNNEYFSIFFIFLGGNSGKKKRFCAPYLLFGGQKNFFFPTFPPEKIKKD